MQRSQILFQVANALGSRDWHHILALTKNPGERQLSGRNTFLGSKFFHCSNELEIGLQGLFTESRIGAAPIARIEIFELLNSSGQESTAQRAVRNERNA